MSLVPWDGSVDSMTPEEVNDAVYEMIDAYEN